ncbi:MAG: helix-turn-helix domain-containing protein [Deltaproteobacteria bacterium]|nr:helix-turn-helix domain-containing protein [Deltaproteobacteria bacterium]
MKPYLTTGEAAVLLGISRSTISRKFDQGILKGKKNPITGERLVSRKSVEAFMKQYDLPLHALTGGKKIVVVGTSDEQLQNAIQQSLKGIDSIEFDHVLFGTDALLHCSKRRADLLVIDDRLPDISGEEVIKAVRRTKEHGEVKIVYCTFDSEAVTLSDSEVYVVHVGKKLNKSLLKEQILAALELTHHPEIPERAPEFERRLWPRIFVNIPAEIETYLVNRRETRQLGTAVVRNLSQGGAYLDKIKLEEGMIPAEPFRMVLRFEGQPLKEWSADCKVLRLQSNGSLAAGLQFMNISRDDQKRVEALIASSESPAAE